MSMGSSSASSSSPAPRQPLGLPKSLSPSSITTWRQCPQLFRWRYIEKRPEPTTTALARGITAHEALHDIFDLPPEARTDEALHELFRKHWAPMRKSERYAGLFESREDERAWGLESLAQLSKWLKLEPEMAKQGAPDAREMRLRSAPPDQLYQITGILDRMDRDTAGAPIIVDYKVGLGRGR